MADDFSLFGDVGDELETKLTFAKEAPQTRRPRTPPGLRRIRADNVDGMVGLHNPGATCYLNSLLQTLFNTAELREAVYRWIYNPEYRRDPPEANCLPLQMQLLFARLQAGGGGAQSTRDLVRTFGWDSDEVFLQKDASEMCDTLFSAIEIGLSGSAYESILRDMYRGTMHDYVKCSVCGRLGGSQSPFYVLGLDVQHSSTLEDALRRYIQPEQLTGANQYSCERCGKKVDATKGQSLVSLPDVLTIQLNRLTFDMQTLRRVKLTHPVVFPLDIDMAPYVNPPSAAPADAPTPAATTDMFELVSVMVHTGTALGGHYFSHTRALDRGGRWYTYNDHSVARADLPEIEAAFGRGGGAPLPENIRSPEDESIVKAFGSAAYMLWYRRRSRAVIPVPEPDPVVAARVAEELKAAPAEAREVRAPASHSASTRHYSF